VSAGVRVVHVLKNGGTEPTEENSYTSETKDAWFKTSHLSLYAVTYEPRSTEDPKDNDPNQEYAPGGGGGCGTGSFGVGALLALAFVASRKRKEV
jgi:hypothetical protein